MFTPDDPEDTSKTSRGTLRLNSVDYRCVRLRPKGLGKSYYDWSQEAEEGEDYEVSEDDKVRFLAVHTAFKDILERHGPQILLVDAPTKAVYVREIEGTSLREFMYDINWDSPQAMDTAYQVIRNALDLISSMERHGLCAPTGTRGYVVRPDLEVAQVDFEEIINTEQGVHCGAKDDLEDSMTDILRNEFYNPRDIFDGYDKVDEIVYALFHA